MKIKEMVYQKDRKIELLCKDKYKNYNYYVLNLGTHPTAYVEIPKGHKLFGINYMDIEDSIDVHGGLTYSDNELMGIKSESWFIGWDYAHAGDYCGYEEYIPKSVRTYGKKWTTEEIIEECKNAINQIIEFEDKEILEEQKKIPEKLIAISNVGELTITYPSNEILMNKINSIIDYLKSKGE